MSEAVFEQLASVEDRLWWHESRRDLIRMFLRRVSFPDNASALDVGCGTGGSFGLLSEYATRVVGLEKSPRALELARRKHPSAELRDGDANALTAGFDAESFDLVTLLNVLYHQWIRDDADVVRQAGEVLKPGGVLLVTDPAFPSLFRRHDRVVLTERRYTLDRTRRLVEGAGLEWVGGSYFNAVSFLPAWMLSKLDRGRSDDDGAPLGEITIPPFPINDLMKLTMACERLAVRLFGRMPLGVSLLAAARRPGIVAAVRSASCRVPPCPVVASERAASVA